MFKKLTQFTLQLIAAANAAAILLMLLTGYAGLLHPMAYPVLTNAGLVFPLFLAINLAFLVFWVVVKLRYVLLPLAGLLLCYGPVSDYCPVSVQREPPQESLKVLSYNVYGFFGDEDGDHTLIPHYIARQNAGIVCLQEAKGNPQGEAAMKECLHDLYPYTDSETQGTIGTTLALYSKYPILSRERLCHSESNLAMAYHIDMDGDTVIVINVHLESTHLSDADRANFRSIVHRQMERDSARVSSQRLAHTLAGSVQLRVPQVEAVAQYIDENAGKPIILCGDFNDSPLSFAHRQLTKQLTDTYVATGLGPGFSYHKNAIYVRIDNILCSPCFVPAACRVDKSIAVSDHYPVVCHLQKREERP